MVRFRDGEPVGIFYSQHAGGAAYEWDDPTLSITDGRVRFQPVVLLFTVTIQNSMLTKSISPTFTVPAGLMQTSQLRGKPFSLRLRPESRTDLAT